MITVCIATSVSLLREGLLRVLNPERGILVSATALSGEEVLRSCRAGHPEVLLLDITLPGRSTASLLRRLRQRGCDAPILLFGTLTPEIAASVRQLEVQGLLSSMDDGEEFVRAVHRVRDGEAFLSTEVERAIHGGVTPTALSHLEELLTPTELQILRALAENRTSREIATGMFISYRTVQKHRANIARKLNLQGRNALLSYALRHFSSHS
jgi:DNA-binding NarL/FixJ family response regulator